MEKVREYAAVSVEPNDFVKSVQKLIDDGWQPIGGMCMTYGKWLIPDSRPRQYTEGFRYGQAFVKY